jgi:hypothetical protein
MRVIRRLERRPRQSGLPRPRRLRHPDDYAPAASAASLLPARSASDDAAP